jgi:AcrR family transcriptional regulator
MITAPRQRLNRDAVIHMAARLADAEGIDAVTLSRLASDAGVKQPALYRHVEGIDELWRLLSLRARSMLVDALSAAIDGRSRDDAVLSVARAWRQFVSEHPGLYSATDRVPSVGHHEVEASLSRVVDILSTSLDGYRLTTAQRAHCARSLRSALHGFCALEKDHGHPEPYALDTSLDHLVQLFCRGIHSLESPD